MTLRSAAQTDIGLFRKRNEDRFLCDEALGLFGVADGIGGLPGGAEAAEGAVEAVRRCIASRSASMPDLQACVTAANRSVIEKGLALNQIQGIGTTLSFGVLRNETLHVAHIGDSRCYLLREGNLLQLSSDHNVETEAKAGITQGKFVHLTERNRGALTRCIGQFVTPEPDIILQPLLPGDLFLFCTDGLYRSIKDKEFVDVLYKTGDLNATFRELIALANARGGYDNSTGVLLKME
jgi:protein phosphatase